MLHFHSCWGVENSWGNEVWTLGCLLAIVFVLSLLQEHLPRFWKHEFQFLEALKKSGDQDVNYLVSPKHTYELREHIASGDLCDVHRAKVGDSECLLKITRVPHGQPLMAKEFSLLELLKTQSGEQVYREYFPQPVESFSRGGQHINAYAWRDGFYTAEQILGRHHHGLEGRHLGWMFNRVLEALGFVHRQGWIHGAVLPPHLLFHAESHGLLLAGWIHAEKVNTSLKVAPDRFKDWYPPECRKKHPATPSVDIYLAAKSLISLAGGDPVSNTFPEHIPPRMQRFVKGCLLESPSMRSQDAWEVRQEFGQVLEGLYGPPAFHPLDMS